MAQFTSPQSWRNFYTKLTQSTGLPRPDESTIVGLKFSKRDLVLDLSTLSTTGKGIIFAFGDVITLSSKEATLDFSRGPGLLYVVGRIFSANELSKLEIKVSHHPVKLTFYLAEIQQPLHIIFSGSASHTFGVALNPENEIGVTFTFRECPTRPGEKAGLTEFRHQTLEAPLHKDPFMEQLMQTQLRIAKLTMYTNPKLSSDLLSFICRITPESRVSSDAYLHASTIKGRLLATHPRAGINVYFVPPVTIKTYENSLNALLDSASSYSAHYDRFISDKATMDARREAAYAMIEQQKAASIAQTQLLTQARIAWKNACDALAVARENAKATEDEVLRQSECFFKDLRSWAKGKRQEAIMNIVGTLIVSVVSVSAILAGNVAGAAGAPSLVRQIADWLKTAQDINKAVDELMTNLGPECETIKKTVTLYKNAIEETTLTIDVIESRRFDATHAKSLNAAESDSTNVIAHWDDWLNNIRNSMENAASQEVPGATAYRVVLERQAVYGKAHCLTRAAAIRAGNDFARALLHSQTMDNHFAEWQSDVEIDSEKLLAKSAVVYDRLLDVKASVIAELHHYKCLYKHFTLLNSSVDLDMSKSLLELQLDFATLKQELVAYLSASSSDPQPFNLTTTSDELPLDQQTIVDDLRDKGWFTFVLSKDHRGPFDGLVRVRLQGLRIWLDGAKPAAGGKKTNPVRVKLRIQTTGLYEDFSDSDSFVFATQPLNRAFWYEILEEGPDEPRGKVLFDAVVPEGDHSPPTPFAQWTVTLLDRKNVDLSGLKSIVFDWCGTAYSGN